MASLPPRRSCEIFSVAHKHACRWKWRALATDGRVDEGLEDYDAYFECVAAARALGLVPRCNWTGPLAQCFPLK